MSLKKCLFFFVAITILTKSVHADPWFTGPLLMDSAQVVPLGDVNLTFYGLSTRNFGVYLSNYSFVSTPRYSSDGILPQFTYGLAKDIDFEVDLYYMKNQNEGQKSANIGDTLMMVGFQLLRQDRSKTRSDLRLTIREIFPTGHYDNLRPNLYTTDATGSGSYQTSIELIAQHLIPLSLNHYINLSGSIILTAANGVNLQGLSIYGGGSETHGHINPGNQISIDLAAEYSVTQNWVAVMETYIYSQQASLFKGVIASDLNAYQNQKAASQSLRSFNNSRSIKFNRITPSKHNIGGAQGIGSAQVTEITIAPELEYNFSKNIGVIGGTWFSVKGMHTPAFISSIIEISITW